MAEDPDANPPILNVMIEDWLAHGDGSEAVNAEMIAVWLTLGAQYLAREVGRAHAVRAIERLAGHIATAQPSVPWKP